MSTEKIGDVSLANLADSSLAKVAQSVYNTDAVTEEQLMFILQLDLEMSVKQLSISASETRQVRQYESNNYHLSIQIDLGESQGIVLERVKAAPVEEKLTVYADAKRTLYAIIREKYSRNENFLRELIQIQKAEDGVKT